MYPHDEDQRLRAGGLKKGMKTDTFNMEKKWKSKSTHTNDISKV